MRTIIGKRRGPVLRSKRDLAKSALVLAGLSVWGGVPAAHGALVVTPIDIGNTIIGGTGYTSYVFTAAGDSTIGTLLATGDVITQVAQSNAGAIGVDIENVSGTGPAAKYTANVGGALQPGESGVPVNPVSNVSESLGQSVFGDPGAGTFGGVSYDYNLGETVPATFNPADITDNPFVAEASEFATAFVYTNNQTTNFGLGSDGGTNANWQAVKLTGTGHLDSAFESNSSTVNTGSIVNGPGLYSLETLFAAFDGTATHFQPANAADPAPFYQVVVKQGTTFTFDGQLDLDRQIASFSTVISGSAPSPLITMSNSAPAGYPIGAPPINASNGPVTVSINPAAQTAGYLDVTGLGSAPEVYGLQIDFNGLPATGSTLASIVAALEASLQSTDTNWNAYTLPFGSPTDPGLSQVALLEGLGDNAELVFPDVSDDIFPNWSLGGLPGSVTITQVTVVPEPAEIGLLMLGGIGLLRRRRAARGI